MARTAGSGLLPLAADITLIVLMTQSSAKAWFQRGQIDEADGPGTDTPGPPLAPGPCTLSPALGRLPWTPGLGAPAQDRCHDDKNGAVRPSSL
ncbi:hypothetical protein [Streptomyces sp. NHF165]|uniref:hypothetical protein n=1 Tax=Streptomyces sp. NHF165 TaxID=2175864 RepID=UPI00135AAACA|nr:hypothetical protein [Streptomyces sp. NHF165]